MAKLSELVESTGTDYDKLLSFYKVKTNSEMTIEQLKSAIEVLEKKENK